MIFLGNFYNFCSLAILFVNLNKQWQFSLLFLLSEIMSAAEIEVMGNVTGGEEMKEGCALEVFYKLPICILKTSLMEVYSVCIMLNYIKKITNTNGILMVNPNLKWLILMPEEITLLHLNTMHIHCLSWKCINNKF